MTIYLFIMIFCNKNSSFLFLLHTTNYASIILHGLSCSWGFIMGDHLIHSKSQIFLNRIYRIYRVNFHSDVNCKTFGNVCWLIDILSSLQSMGHSFFRNDSSYVIYYFDNNTFKQSLENQKRFDRAFVTYQLLKKKVLENNTIISLSLFSKQLISISFKFSRTCKYW